MTRLLPWPLLAALLAAITAQVDAQQQRPVLRMVQDYVQVHENQTASVQLGVQLVGSTSEPVQAWLGLAAPQQPQPQQEQAQGAGAVAVARAAGVQLLDGPEAWLSPSELSWSAHESGVRYVQLRSALELLSELDEGAALVVRIGAAVNADIHELRGTTILSLVDVAAQLGSGVGGGSNVAEADLDPELPLFGFVPNQVAYPPARTSGSSISRDGRSSSKSSDGSSSSQDAVHIPVRLLSGNLTEAATVAYSVSLLTPAEEQFLPSRALFGFLVFEPGTTEQNISLPVQWDRVPPGAEYRLGVDLDGLWDVRTQNQSDDTVALHIFGVPDGTCPPGTALAAGAANSTRNGGAVQQHKEQNTPSHAAWWQDLPGLEDWFLMANGSTVELSGRDVANSSTRAYGAMVPSEAGAVVMCIKAEAPLLGVGIVEQRQGLLSQVRHGADELCGCGLPADAKAAAGARAMAASPAPGPQDGSSGSSSSSSSSGEMIAGAPGPAPSQELVAMASSPAAESHKPCNYMAWQLALGFGQNEFNLTFRMGVKAAAKKGSGSGRVRITSSRPRTLAVVRLADPAHAELASLTLSLLDGTSVLLCGEQASEPMQLAAASLAGLEHNSSSGGSEGSDGGVAGRMKVLEMDSLGLVPDTEASSSSNGSSGPDGSAAANGTEAEDGASVVDSSGSGNGVAFSKLQDMLAPGVATAPLSRSTKPCLPGVAMSVSVSHKTEVVTLSPTLLFPGVNGVRVEVNGQVLSRGGDAAADQQGDTSSLAQQQQQQQEEEAADGDSGSADASPPPFLPAAFFIGLQPSVPVDIQVVVVAEDGVTSSRYPLAVTRLPPPPTMMAASLSSSGGSGGDGGSSGESDNGSSSDAPEREVKYESPVSHEEQRQKGWPTPPALQETCTVCPAGWASFEVNSTKCTMCPPGTYAAESQSAHCLPCEPGSFAYSWGSSHCKHCIAGTYAPQPAASLCTMCPANWTSLEDGQASCPAQVTPALDLSKRHAVLVSFSVVLSGLDQEDVLLKVGLSAPVEQIVGSLIQSDTASAFNISLQDVTVLTSRHVARRTLQANVTAALGVDLPPGSTDEDIAAALEVQKLSADAPIEMLSQDPSRFFGRTTRTLDVEVKSSATTPPVVYWPGDSGPAFNPLFVLLPGALAVVVGCCLLFWAARRSPRFKRWWGAQAARWRERRSWRLPTAVAQRLGGAAQRYTRYTAS